ncbi:hypothetical protein B1813_14980 [Saccharomonospora piscinae]|uniref:Glycosyltransferase RgtA/B/C/D-like domain-containing protein n=1 Tax=Saccharomonospora piscinae TaxID=687388 RepID=A0A1V9A1E1_SACPI|nr:hypothetical protein B1813_14980 [Saccharomonospora piscinae]
MERREPSPFGTRRATLVVVGAAAVLAAAIFAVVKDSLIDDAYITLSYAKNLAVHGEWGLVPGMTANSATSPLNVLLLGTLTALTRVTGDAHPVVALGALTVLATAVLAWGWTRLARAYRFPWPVAALGVLVVLSNPFVLSAIGLEVLLIPAVLMLLTVFAVEGRPVAFGVAAALAVLTRLDLVVFVLAIALCAVAIRRRIGHAVLAAVVVAAPWYVFSWIALGSAVPDTLVIKQEQDGLFGRWTYATGPVMYYFGQEAAVLLAFGPALLGLIAWCGLLAVRLARTWDRFPGVSALVGLGGGAIAYYLVYTALGVGPYHWYYVAPATALAMFAVAALGVWLAVAREHATLMVRAPVTALGVVAALVAGAVGVGAAQGVPWRSPVIFGNWAGATDYAHVGRQLGERVGQGTVASPGEIGTLAYHCECRILDVFSDRGRVAELVKDRVAESGPVSSALLELNYLFFDHDATRTPVEYRLRYERGPGGGDNTWQVYSEALGVGHFTLVAARQPDTRPHPEG